MAKNKTSESYLFKNHKISVVPPALELNEWFPVDQMKAREILKLPKNKKFYCLCRLMVQKI